MTMRPWSLLARCEYLSVSLEIDKSPTVKSTLGSAVPRIDVPTIKSSPHIPRSGDETKIKFGDSQAEPPCARQPVLKTKLYRVTVSFLLRAASAGELVNLLSISASE